MKKGRDKDNAANEGKKKIKGENEGHHTLWMHCFPKRVDMGFDPYLTPLTGPTLPIMDL